MAAGTVKSENITNIEASPPTILDRKKGRLRKPLSLESKHAVSWGSGQGGSLYRACSNPAQ